MVHFTVEFYDLNTHLQAQTQCAGYPTLLGTDDNCPPSAEISYPVLHKNGAGGVGSYADPITYAGVTAATPKGTIIYVHALKKYFIHEDSCEECATDWKVRLDIHILRRRIWPVARYTILQIPSSSILSVAASGVSRVSNNL